MSAPPQHSLILCVDAVHAACWACAVRVRHCAVQDCGHTFCTSCVLQLLASDQLGRCPLCRRPEALVSARRRFSLELVKQEATAAPRSTEAVAHRIPT